MTADLRPASAPRRFWRSPGLHLTRDDIRGPWRPSGTAGGAGVFAVVWSSGGTDYWAPLHDFLPEAQQSLLEECRWADRVAGYPGAWPEGRSA